MRGPMTPAKAEKILSNTKKREIARVAGIKARRDAKRAHIAECSSALGKLIRFQREDLDLSQKEVAKALGFSNVFLGRIEFGKCDLPLNYVDKLAKILGLSKQEILFAIKHDINNQIDARLKE